MNIVCVICSDLLVPSDDVFYTQCGHIFHFLCLTQWLERSKSCPQCREKTTSNKIHRIYFNFSNNDTIVEDTCSLQDKVDKLNFQILLRDKEIKDYIEKNELLTKQTAGLRKHVLAVEGELNTKDSTIRALKEQIKYFREQCSQVDTMKQEVERLQKKIAEYRSVQTLLAAPAEDVDKMISTTCDPNTLITYISVMKREMTTSLSKRRELRTRVHSLQEELTRVSMERNFLSEEHDKRKKLERDLMACESEKMCLQNELRDLRKSMSQSKKSATSGPKKVKESHTSNIEATCSESKGQANEAEEETEEPVKTKEHTSMDKKLGGSEEGSPYLPIQTQGVSALKQEFVVQRKSTKLGHSILAKKPRIGETSTGNKRMNVDMITFDGFGGHSKYDFFPTPISTGRPKKTKDEVNRPKKIKLDTGDNKKLGDFVSTFTLEQ